MNQDHVYLLWHRGQHKIGLSMCPRVRAYNLTGSDGALVHSFPSDDARLVERTLHHHYRDKRIRGEWFALTDADVAAFRAVERCDRPEDYPIPLDLIPRGVPLFVEVRSDLYEAAHRLAYIRRQTIRQVVMDALRLAMASPPPEEDRRVAQ